MIEKCEYRPKVFKDLAEYALAVHCLPTSNAYVERVFSIVSFMKDKYSNRMGLPMLDSLLLLKTHLQAVIYLVNSSHIYLYSKVPPMVYTFQ